MIPVVKMSIFLLLLIPGSRKKNCLKNNFLITSPYLPIRTQSMLALSPFVIIMVLVLPSTIRKWQNITSFQVNMGIYTEKTSLGGVTRYSNICLIDFHSCFLF